MTSTTWEQPETTDTERPVRLFGAGWRWFSLTLLIAVVVGAGVFVWQAVPRPPGEDSAEAGFLRDMEIHHDQAVEMSLIIRDRTDDEALAAMATDILLTQMGQIGMMQGWLDLWDLSPTRLDPAMAWMEHDVDGLMPGMATSEQIDQLRTLPPAEAEVLFLELMIRHHQGGVLMAEGYLDRGDQPEVRHLAESIAAAQTKEIEAMNSMLESRGAEPITDELPSLRQPHPQFTQFFVGCLSRVVGGGCFGYHRQTVLG